MRVVFAGSAELACPALLRLINSPVCDVAAVISQPDRPVGRRLQVKPCPVKALLEKSQTSLPVFTPENINSSDALETIRGYEPDVLVVVAYGQIFRAPLLELAPHGCINVHASLLPKYRGAAPFQWAVINGETVTGVTTMYMNRGMDTGDIILQREIGIGAEETAGELHDRLAVAGADLLEETLVLLEKGNAPRRPQDDSQASMARKLSKADGKIDWELPAGQLHNRVRGMNPWPVCFCLAPAGSEQRLRVLRSRPEEGKGRPGELIAVNGDGPLVAAGAGALRLLQVQPQNGRVMAGTEYLHGHQLRPGVFLG